MASNSFLAMSPIPSASRDLNQSTSEDVRKDLLDLTSIDEPADITSGQCSALVGLLSVPVESMAAPTPDTKKSVMIKEFGELLVNPEVVAYLKNSVKAAMRKWKEKATQQCNGEENEDVKTEKLKWIGSESRRLQKNKLAVIKKAVTEMVKRHNAFRREEGEPRLEVANIYGLDENHHNRKKKRARESRASIDNEEKKEEEEEEKKEEEAEEEEAEEMEEEMEPPARKRQRRHRILVDEDSSDGENNGDEDEVNSNGVEGRKVAENDLHDMDEEFHDLGGNSHDADRDKEHLAAIESLKGEIESLQVRVNEEADAVSILSKEITWWVEHVRDNNHWCAHCTAAIDKVCNHGNGAVVEALKEVRAYSTPPSGDKKKKKKKKKKSSKADEPSRSTESLS